MMRALANEGVTGVRDFRDPTAMRMLPPAWQLLARAYLWQLRAIPAYRKRRTT